jgi:hypothetical protein
MTRYDPQFFTQLARQEKPHHSGTQQIIPGENRFDAFAP